MTESVYRPETQSNAGSDPVLSHRAWWCAFGLRDPLLPHLHWLPEQSQLQNCVVWKASQGMTPTVADRSHCRSFRHKYTVTTESPRHPMELSLVAGWCGPENKEVCNGKCGKWTLYTITLRNFVAPTHSTLGDPLSGNGCGSPNHILLSFHLCFIYSFCSSYKIM